MPEILFNIDNFFELTTCSLKESKADCDHLIFYYNQKYGIKM